jgi:hypothetical protein
MKFIDTRTPAGGKRGQTRAGAWVFTPVLLLALAGLLVAFVSPAISWALGAGTPGVFTVRILDCHKGCAWIGEFTSSDRLKVAQDVQLVTFDGLPKLKPGDTVHVIDVSSIYGNSAYPRRPTIRNILSISFWPFEIMALLLVFFFLRWIWTVPVRYFRWRLSGAVPLPASDARRRVIPPPWSRSEDQARTR